MSKTSERIRYARTACRLTVRELADFIGNLPDNFNTTHGYTLTKIDSVYKLANILTNRAF